MLKILFNIWFKFPEKIRFILVGGWNTLFSILIFFLFLFLKIEYKLALFFTHIISVCNSFLCLKIFVFRSKFQGVYNFVKEYLKVNIIYAIYFILNFILLILFVEKLKIIPLFSQIIITCILTILSYLGHKYFTFKDGKTLN